MAAWTTANIPPQHGRTVVVTGANSGLGLATTRELVNAGARVVMAVRDVDAGRTVAADLGGAVAVGHLDLADLTSVREFAASVDGPVDVLVNNAGLMGIPRASTADGFEMQLGVNYLGHFALTGLLLDRITDRVVTLSSMMHRIGRIRLDDIDHRHGRYERWTAYGRSKLACLMFAYELEYRFTGAGSRLRSLAAHPGYAATNLQSRTQTVADAVMGVLNKVIAQSGEDGALPTLYAATEPDLPGGTYIGPGGPGEMWGGPVPVGSTAASHDRAVRRRLWELSEQLTGVPFPV